MIEDETGKHIEFIRFHFENIHSNFKTTIATQIDNGFLSKR